ncbi:MAG: LysR family transcriptional regulator, partial [Pseudomonadota bacterium]
NTPKSKTIIRNIRMYSVDDLKTFVAIAETLGVTAGARRVGVSPATASHRLNKLETALGLTLFRRDNRSLQLTDEGQIFFERAQPILDDLAQAERDAGSGSAQLSGHIRVTLAPWILARFILPNLSRFHAQHPKLTLEFLAVDRYVSLAAEGQDCAIRVGVLADSGLVARKLCDNERIICASPDFLTRHGHPQSLEQALSVPWVSLPWQSRIAFTGAAQQKLDATVPSALLVSNSDRLTDAAVHGLGLAVKSRLAIKDELDTGQLVEVLPNTLWEPRAPIWFVYPPETRKGVKADVFGALATEVFKALP